MSWPNDYIAGTARKLPALYDAYGWGAGSDYTELAAFLSDRVTNADLSARGKVLVLPAGTLIEEAAAGTGFELNPANDSATNFAAIVCDDPASKARLQVTNNWPYGVELYAVNLYGHSKIYDCAVGLTSSSDLVGVNAAVIHTRSDADTVIVGCTNNNIIVPNVATSPVYLYLIMHDGLGGLVLCAYDQSKTINIGTAGLIGAGVGSNCVGYIYNSVFNDLIVGVINTGAFDIECINVCSQGSTGGGGNFLEYSTGALNLTTCADEQGLTFAADGFTLTTADGQGTNLSADAAFPFKDDIAGVAWGALWDRATNYEGIMRPDCVFFVSVPVYGDREDQVSSTTPTAQGNGWRYSLPSLNAGVEAALGGFVPSDVPQAEADALIAFYIATTGSGWTTDTNWLTDPVVDNWFGVTVSGSPPHVTGLALPGNNLSGSVGATLDPLASVLTALDLSGNSLSTTDVNHLLDILDTAGNSGGSLDLGVHGVLSAEGVADTISLIGKSWTVWCYASVAVANCRLATKDGEAMFFDEVVDFSAYAGSGGATPYYLAFKDSANKYAYAYGYTQGAGEALGANALAGLDFTLPWSTVTATINDANTFTNTAASGYVYKNILSIGSIYKSSLAASVTVGTARLTGASTNPVFSANDTNNTYRTAFSPGCFFNNNAGGIGAVTDITTATMYPLTNVSATGLLLVSASGGATRNMTSVEAGFNPNAITSITVIG